MTFERTAPGPRPLGYFVHHQGRGHAERCAAVVNALPDTRPVVVFSARDDIFPPLRDGVRVRKIPSLFEPQGNERTADWIATPDTLHCAPVGWPGIRQAMGQMAHWFASADPVLMICDVSAEIAQLARLCSVPHVKVLQHGERTDPGHRAAYDGAAGLLAPFDARLAQDDWDSGMRARTHFAPGLGCAVASADPAAARKRLGIGPDERIVLAVSGGGGGGFASAPLALGARSMPDARWITVGPVSRDWHGTEPANLCHAGWIDDIADHLAAADLVISSTGNTICQQVLGVAKPWIAVPEWRYFDEQLCKAKALHRVGVAHYLHHLPSSAQAWRHAIAQARAGHVPDIQRSMVNADAARGAANWIESLIARLRSPVDRFSEISI